ncbi:MAG: hypothetical protein ACFFCP_17670 [Promethearchaeota archaeon]
MILTEGRNAKDIVVAITIGAALLWSALLLYGLVGILTRGILDLLGVDFIAAIVVSTGSALVSVILLMCLIYKILKT